MKFLLWIVIFAFIYNIAKGGHFIWIGLNALMLIFTITTLIRIEAIEKNSGINLKRKIKK